MFYDAKEFKVHLPDGSMSCISFGKGSKPMVMVPGLRISEIDGSAAAVAWFYRLFAKEYKVYVFDKKDCIHDGYTVHDLAEDLACAMEKLEIKQACVLGVSLGGMISQDLAINHPDLVSKLVLAVTASRMNQTIHEVVTHWIDIVDTQGLGAVSKDYMEKGFSEQYLKKYKLLVPLAMKMQKYLDIERFKRLAEACLTVDSYKDLDKIQCPVLVLGGGKDKIVTGQASLEMAEKLGCECHMYPELSHEAYNEAKDFNMRVWEFFQN